jgi:MAPEG family
MPSLTEFPSPSELRGAVYGTVLYIVLYSFGFIQFQSYTKFYIYYRDKQRAKKDATKKNDPLPASKTGGGSSSDNTTMTSFRNVKYYNTTDLLALNGDRTVGNFLEQAIVFLPLLWIHALFVDPSPSFTICILYTGIRCLYPFLFYTKWMFACTIPGYGITIYLMYQIVSNL